MFPAIRIIVFTTTRIVVIMNVFMLLIRYIIDTIHYNPLKKVLQEITTTKQQTNKIAANAVKCLWVPRSAEMPRILRKQRPGRAAAKTTATKITLAATTKSTRTTKIGSGGEYDWTKWIGLTVGYWCFHRSRECS